MKLDAIERANRKRSRMGPWRLLDLVQATVNGRMSGMFSGMAVLPEYGPPDMQGPNVDPPELPDSNISVAERRQALEREVWRRELATRRTGTGA
jgi:hypothetical protein